jgi:hypothetical protein
MLVILLRHVAAPAQLVVVRLRLHLPLSEGLLLEVAIGQVQIWLCGLLALVRPFQVVLGLLVDLLWEHDGTR